MAKKKKGTDLDTVPDVRLKPAEVASHRNKLLKEQLSTCPLCMKYIHAKDAALDHCHTTGRCRSTLHRNCNSVEGRVLHWARRAGCDPKLYLKNLLVYWDQDYSSNPIHPNHRTPIEKKVRTLRRRMNKAKRSTTKARLKQEILELQNE